MANDGRKKEVKSDEKLKTHVLILLVERFLHSISNLRYEKAKIT